MRSVRRNEKRTQASGITLKALGKHATTGQEEGKSQRGCVGNHLGSVLARKQRLEIELLGRLADNASGSRHETPSKIGRRPAMTGGDLAEICVVSTGHQGHSFGLIPAVFLEESFGVHTPESSNMLFLCQ